MWALFRFDNFEILPNRRISRARKYRLALTLAHQQTAQIPTGLQRGGRRPTSLSLHYAKLKMTGQTKFERYRVDLVRMMEEGVAKKEMARRTGLSVPTVRKYLKLID